MRGTRMARTGTGARLPFYTIALVMAGLTVMAVLAFGIGVASRAMRRTAELVLI